ncbi:hypothetical protein HPB47_002004 [Ixodes persulcatus]|uniref:Uncharacterized protein n=1 Tax=Ixodes persulcatus TaxID=34615 RepID=A0AC60PME9_IXOPE|nr:hypothetical protein HPB47_002004 [Ixodes persulcatus]
MPVCSLVVRDCKNSSGLIKGEGYPFERHDVVTRDGYIIEMHRIPREPIFVMTGLLADSASFVLDFPKQSLGYVLADNKYDVWLGNTRGNTYGKRHKRYSPKSRRFWNFSFHEHAKYDAPAQIDYILNVTKRNSLLYVGLVSGHSHVLHDDVKAFAGLAPFNKLAHMVVPPLEPLPPFAESFLRAANAAGQYEVMPQGSPFMPIARRFCSLITSRIVCSLIGDSLTNYGSSTRQCGHTPMYLSADSQMAKQPKKKKKKKNINGEPARDVTVCGTPTRPKLLPPLFTLETLGRGSPPLQCSLC